MNCVGGDVCCEGACSDSDGCFTVPGSCGTGDTCTDIHVLQVTSTCEYCGAIGADGTCETGDTFTCNDTTHTLCESTDCGGVTYYCTNLFEAWQWRAENPSCNDSNDCTFGDTCGGSGCTGTDFSIDCAWTDCNHSSCDGEGGCINDYMGSSVSCGDATICPTDYCTGSGTSLSFNNFPDSCQGACDGAGGCDPCTCEEDDPVACTYGGCCLPDCDSGGCGTYGDVCPDSCGVTVLDINQGCVGCGAAGATGTCGGDSYTCDADHQCDQHECDGSTYYCTSVGGSWAWTTNPTCDDGDAMTEEDTCQPDETCSGVSASIDLMVGCAGWTTGMLDDRDEMSWSCGTTSYGPGGDSPMDTDSDVWAIGRTGSLPCCESSYLRSASTDLSGFTGMTVWLNVDTWYDFRDCGSDAYSGGIVQVSTNGSSWSEIAPVGGYSGDEIYCKSVSGACDATDCEANNKDGFNHYDGHESAWRYLRFNISSYITSTFYVRFVYGNLAGYSCSSCDEQTGWFVDNAIITGE